MANPRLLLYTALSLVLSLAVALATSAVVELTPDNFDKVLDESKSVFIEFYAPWCGHCKSLAPIYEELANAFSHTKDSVVIAKVDADAHRELGTRFGITGFPTLKFFKDDKTQPIDYKQGRDLDSLTSFITSQVGVHPRISKPKSFVQSLTAATFDSVALDPKKNVLVEFYAPWCGHCKSLAPTYEEVAQIFQNEPNCFVTKVDGTEAPSLRDKYGIKGYPTFLFFPAGSDKPIPYESGRSKQDFIDFLNEQCKTHRLNDGRLDDQGGLIDLMNRYVSDFVQVATAKRDKVIKDAKAAAVDLKDQYALYYVKVMEKLSANKDFVTKELSRLEKVLGNRQLAPNNADNFSIRRNILKLFSKSSEEATDASAGRQEL
ncbi:hypothetical protein IWQ61_003301 [Dispira simplex]|nr:hypothetical protein IWQ61_003301 [Dispira simplex]